MVIDTTLKQKNIILVNLPISSINFIHANPYQANSLDYGFDFDDDQLSQELLSPLPSNFFDRPSIHIDADDFDRLYHWFVS